MVVSSVSACLSAPAPSPVSFMVIISVLPPCAICQQGRLQGFPAGWDHVWAPANSFPSILGAHIL